MSFTRTISTKKDAICAKHKISPNEMATVTTRTAYQVRELTFAEVEKLQDDFKKTRGINLVYASGSVEFLVVDESSITQQADEIKVVDKVVDSVLPKTEQVPLWTLLEDKQVYLFPGCKLFHKSSKIQDSQVEAWWFSGLADNLRSRAHPVCLQSIRRPFKWEIHHSLLAVGLALLAFSMYSDSKRVRK